MFRTTAFDKLLDKATSNLLMEQDWPTILQICDLIRQNDVTPRNALAALKKKLLSPNPHTAMFAVQLLESMVKNCGSSLHDELTTPAYCEVLHDLVKTTTHENVRQKMLELIQAWTYAFRKNTKYNALKDTMNSMTVEGFKFPVQRESDAMFCADSAPAWADGEVCHRCRAQFTLVNRKHHCRACGQVFCSQCSAKTSTLPKFGIEKEVRVCDACFDQVNKPTTAPAATKDPELEEYLKSSLAQQNQAPPRKSEAEIREEEEFQLALALSQSEAEAKEKEKMRATSAYSNYKQDVAVAAPVVKPVERSPSPEHPELARYLNRQYWENRPHDSRDSMTETIPTSPSAPATAPNILGSDSKIKENGVVDIELEEFVRTLKSQVEIFINRMKSNSSRGRSIANDSSVQTLFMNITAMHSKLLKYIQSHDDSRLHYERLQDKLTQVKDARAALDALREEHREKLRRQAEEAERQRQMLMAHKLEIMRKKKQEYLQYQRQIALHRIQEQEREMHMRQEQQKQQYMMGGPQYFIGSPPVHAYAGTQGFGSFTPPPMMGGNTAAPAQSYQGRLPAGLPLLQNVANLPNPPHPGQQPGLPHQQQPGNIPPQNMQPAGNGPNPNMGGTPTHMPPQGGPPPGHGQPPQGGPNMVPQSPNIPGGMMPPNNMAPQQMMPNPNLMPPGPPGGNLQQYQQPPQGNMQPGAPPASPQMPKEETTTAELISFD